MSVALVILGVLLAMTVVAFAAAAPMSYRARRRRLTRRRRWVAGHPDSAKSHDVVDLLRRSGLLMREARDLTEVAAERGVRSVTLYRWLNRLDDDVRITVLRAGLSDAHLVEHVGRGTLPDLPGVREFAEAHGLAVAPIEDRRSAVRERRAPERPAENLASEPTNADLPGDDGAENGDQRAAVIVQEAPVVTQQLVVEPPATMPAQRPVRTASATLVGFGIGTQTPVP